jgi:dipeptidyl aminopeptidase/acylaminoacyl peptidase
MIAMLIPRRKLFGDPSRTQANISPDGRWLSWLAPRAGVLNVWVAPVDDLAAARSLTTDARRGILFHLWAYDGAHLLYIQDRNGDENWHVYAIDVASEAARNLTPIEGVHATIAGASIDRPHTLVIGLNDRDARWHDLYEINIATGDRRLILRNEDELSDFVLDRGLSVRLAWRSLAGGDRLVLRNDRGSFREMLRIAHEDTAGTHFVNFNAAGNAVFALSSIGRDKTVLVKFNWATGEQVVLAEHGKADIDSLLLDPVSDEPEAASASYLRREWLPVTGGEAARRDLDFLARELAGEIAVASQTKDNRQWVVHRSRAEEPGSYYLFDRGQLSLRELFSTRPELSQMPLRPMRAMVIRARDGLECVSYLTLPEEGGARPQAKHAMVVLVHGGPWSRDFYGFDTEHQWLANRGYAVLSVNFRGSTGFGKAFLNAGDLEWGRRMQHDLLDAVAWAVAEGTADPDRIAIMGASYGGYATLAALAFTPEVFCCGVDRVGPSNLETMLATAPPYWASIFEFEARRVGDPRTEDGRALLRERSPLHRAHAITKPLLIGQGANDPRVKQAESDQIVAAMRERKLAVTYVLYSDEGHRFVRPQNRLSWYAIAETFLAVHLGGSAEPIGQDLEGANLEVIAGAQHIAGLGDALRAVQPAPPTS